MGAEDAVNRQQTLAIVAGAVVLGVLGLVLATAERGGGFRRLRPTDAREAERQMSQFEDCIVNYRAEHGRLPHTEGP